MYSSCLDFLYKKVKGFIAKFTNPDPEIHTEELVNYIEKKTKLSKNIILTVLLAEEKFLEEKGIVIR